MALTVMPDNISVMPFTGEIHSTVDYNGIAVVGDMPGISDLSLTVDTLTSVVDRIKSSLWGRMKVRCHKYISFFFIFCIIALPFESSGYFSV